MNLNKHRIGAYLKGSGKTEAEDAEAVKLDPKTGLPEEKQPEGLVKVTGKQDAAGSRLTNKLLRDDGGRGSGSTGGLPKASGADDDRLGNSADSDSPVFTTVAGGAGDIATTTGNKAASKGEKPNKRDIAKYLMLIGKAEAASILQHLPPGDVEAIVREIATIDHIKPEEAQVILARFSGLVKTGKTPAGGIETARSILVNAFGENVGGNLLRKALPEEKEPFFSFLQDMEPGQVVGVLRGESVAVKSIVLAYLPPASSAAILKASPKDEQKELILRLGRMKKVDRDVLERIQEALKERIREHGNPRSEEFDGSNNLAQIMRHLDPELEEKLLGVLAEEAPDVAETIKERLFTIDTLLLIDDRDLQKVLSSLENKQIALILKGKNDSIRRKILTNVSDNRATFISEEYQGLGPQPRRDVDLATREFITHLRNLEQEGTITVRRDDEEYI